MPLQPPLVPNWRAGIYEHANPVGGQPSVVGFNTGIRDALSFLTARIVFRAHQTAAQSIASGTWTAINWAAGGIDEDLYGGWSSGNPNRWTAPNPGTYLAFGTVWFSGVTAANTVGLAAIPFDQFITAAGSIQSANEMPAPTDNTPWGIPCSWSSYLAAGDYFTLAGYQSSGAAINTSTGAGQQCQLDIYWLSG